MFTGPAQLRRAAREVERQPLAGHASCPARWSAARRRRRRCRACRRSGSGRRASAAMCARISLQRALAQLGQRLQHQCRRRIRRAAPCSRRWPSSSAASWPFRSPHRLSGRRVLACRMASTSACSSPPRMDAHRRDLHRLLPALGGGRVVVAGHRAADVVPVRGRGQEAEQPAGAKHRQHQLEVVGVGAAFVGVVEEPDVAVLHAAARLRPPRSPRAPRRPSRRRTPAAPTCPAPACRRWRRRTGRGRRRAPRR